MSGKAALSASLVALLCAAPAVARAQGQQGQQQAQQPMQVTLHFEGERTELSDSARAVLDQRIPMFRANPEMQIVILPDVCAHVGMDDLKAPGDTMEGRHRAGDTVGVVPTDTSIERQREPGDTGGALIREDTGEAKAAGAGWQSLVAKRAQATKDYLVRHGVQENRIEVAVKQTGARDRERDFPRDTAERQGGQMGQQGWRQTQADCPQPSELKSGEQQFRLLIPTSSSRTQHKTERQPY